MQTTPSAQTVKVGENGVPALTVIVNPYYFGNRDPFITGYEVRQSALRQLRGGPTFQSLKQISFPFTQDDLKGIPMQLVSNGTAAYQITHGCLGGLKNEVRSLGD